MKINNNKGGINMNTYDVKNNAVATDSYLISASDLNAWENYPSKKLRRIYWLLKNTNQNFLSSHEVAKMNTFKEILIDRRVW
tara:strand:+ start:197 stop:442 length:246 start_codon:yes stop_codon:yes gene_type:complete